MPVLNERRLKTQQALIDAFFELYATRNIERITVNDIVKKAGYNRSTFYAYFRDVYEILEKVEEQLVQVAEKVGTELLASLTDDSIDEEMAVIHLLIKKNQSSFPTIISKHGPGFIAKLRESILRSCRVTYPLLSEEDLDLFEQCLTYHFSAVFGMLSYWYQREGNIPIDTVFPLIKELSLTGVLSKVRSLTAA